MSAKTTEDDSIVYQIDDIDGDDVRSESSDLIYTSALEDWELLAKRENDRFGNTETRIYETPTQFVVVFVNMDGIKRVKQVGESVEFEITGVREYGDTSGEFYDEIEIEPQNSEDDGRRGVGDPTGWLEDAWSREIEEHTFNEHGFREITSDTAVFEGEHEGVVYEVRYELVEGQE